MSVFQCVECEQHYCAECEGGEDACPECRTGPRCDECAVAHYGKHFEGKDESDEAVRS